MNKENEEKTNEVKSEKPQEQKAQPMRQIIIEFDNSSVNIPKSDAASNFELIAILQTIVNKLTSK